MILYFRYFIEDVGAKVVGVAVEHAAKESNNIERFLRIEVLGGRGVILSPPERRQCCGPDLNLGIARQREMSSQERNRQRRSRVDVGTQLHSLRVQLDIQPAEGNDLHRNTFYTLTKYRSQELMLLPTKLNSRLTLKHLQMKEFHSAQ